MVSNLFVTSNRLRILLKVGVEVSSILVAGIGGAGFRQKVIILNFIQNLRCSILLCIPVTCPLEAFTSLS